MGEPTILAVSLSLAVIAYLCWRLSRVCAEASVLAGCIAEMLLNPQRATQAADDARNELVRRGIWEQGDG